MTLGDEYVLARLKASSARLAGLDLHMEVMTNTDSTGSLQSSQGSNESKKKKKKTRSKKSRNRRNSKSTSAPASNGSNNAFSQSAQRPPSLTADHFPSLQDDKKVEWETPPDEPISGKGLDDDNKSEGSGESPKSVKAFSDGASTATTTSSSMESMPKKVMPMGGYAAALLKPATVKPKSYESTGVTNSKKITQEANQPIAKISKESNKFVKPNVITATSLWGQRRSFADILRQEKVDKVLSS